MFLTFHRSHVLEQGKEIGLSKRQRKLYTNCTGDSGYERRGKWSHVIFEHPSSFETIALNPEKKEIVGDLVTFSKAKEYYAKIGKPWKRGYLLYGPPGTGKSSLVAAIANFLKYDIYVIELTNVETNAELRKLDQALIRRGRMDMHIELSYCGFDGFKMLAMNYLSIESHPLFKTV